MFRRRFNPVNKDIPTKFDDYRKQGAEIRTEVEEAQARTPIMGNHKELNERDAAIETVATFIKIRDDPNCMPMDCIDDIQRLGKYVGTSYDGDLLRIAVIPEQSNIAIEPFNPHGPKRNIANKLISPGQFVSMPDIASCIEHIRAMQQESLEIAVVQLYKVPMMSGGHGLFLLKFMTSIAHIDIDHLSTIIAEITADISAMSETSTVVCNLPDDTATDSRNIFEEVD
mgnify:CR=1 FL=1